MDFEQIPGRLMYTKSEAQGLNVCTNSCYAPQSLATKASKETKYEELEKWHIINSKSCINIKMGDFNARVGKCGGPHEEYLIGQHTFQPDSANLGQLSEGVSGNRALFLQFLQDTRQLAINTFFDKAEYKKMSYRQDKQNQWGPPYDRPKYETLDYICLQHRWRNGCIDVESDPTANTTTDHHRPFDG